MTTVRQAIEADIKINTDLVQTMYELMSIKERKRLHEIWGGDCLTDIQDILK